MRAVLVLGWIQNDVYRFFVAGNVQLLAIGLIHLGNHLQLHSALRHRREVSDALLVGF